MLRAAFDGDADYTATGDRHLLKLKKFMNMTMITVKEMLKTQKNESPFSTD